MTTHSTSTGASLERALRHWRERGVLLELPPHKETAAPMTIAISRECGAGGFSIAQGVAKRIGWPVYDRQLVDKIADDTGIQTQLLDRLDEHRPNWMTECLKGLSHEKHISGAGFAIRLKKILLALYCHGGCILLGRGAAQILPRDRTLSVRLIASEDYRVGRIAVHMQMTEAEAKKHIAEVDRSRSDFVHSYFHRDVTDPSKYDLSINTSSFSEIACVDLVLAALERHCTNN